MSSDRMQEEEFLFIIIGFNLPYKMPLQRVDEQ